MCLLMDLDIGKKLYWLHWVDMLRVILIHYAALYQKIIKWFMDAEATMGKN